MPELQLVTDLRPAGDQPRAIERLVEGLRAGHRFQTLLGATGTGKTYTMAAVIERVQRPTLVLVPNKTLAAQLYGEFREFFPRNAVEYFVSFYDYYQPEAYVPKTDTYVEKDSEKNEEIEKRRLSTTRSLAERRDVVVVASVSCIYGIGSAEDFHAFALPIARGERRRRDRLLRGLNDMGYRRGDADLTRGTYRVRGETIELFPAYDDLALRVTCFGDEVEVVETIDPLTGDALNELDGVTVYPARHFVTPAERIERALVTIEAELAEQVDGLRMRGRIAEAERLRRRTEYDLTLLRETGTCQGIENYASHLSARRRVTAERGGETPWTLLDYFPDDFLLFVDESHVALPQARGMHRGDRSRKEVLVDFGFRLPSALDNRPLTFEELEAQVGQAVFVSATPGPYELEHSGQSVEQLIRPTGLLDPVVEVRPSLHQVDDLLGEIRIRVARSERALVTVMTKEMAEQLAAYLAEMGVRVHHLHAEIEVLERAEILRDLRLGVYDVVVGINLLREGLDLPEVSLVAILDADREGYLRSETALIQTIGRAARHVEGRAIMYADGLTDSMRRAIAETERRRRVQAEHNQRHGITPQGVQKAIRDLAAQLRGVAAAARDEAGSVAKEDVARLIVDLERQMKRASQGLEFERAILLRDQIHALRANLADADLAEAMHAAASTRPPRGRRGHRLGRRTVAR
ncbi:MAG TPA: excinuclease ABC subunit UvrB [Chloroflexota bacterium]